MSKTLRPRINKVTKLPIYDSPVEYRINNIYKELTGLTKVQAMRALSNNNLSESWKLEIKGVLFVSKLAGIQSSIRSLQVA